MNRLERIVWVTGMLNMLVFFLLHIALGGSVFGGAQEDGRYFLGSKGRLTEVSQTTYRISQIQGASMLLTSIAVFVVGAVARARDAED